MQVGVQGAQEETLSIICGLICSDVCSFKMYVIWDNANVNSECFDKEISIYTDLLVFT